LHVSAAEEAEACSPDPCNRSISYVLPIDAVSVSE
jgi:hypothetical protein